MLKLKINEQRNELRKKSSTYRTCVPVASPSESSLSCKGLRIFTWDHLISSPAMLLKAKQDIPEKNA